MKIILDLTDDEIEVLLSQVARGDNGPSYQSRYQSRMSDEAESLQVKVEQAVCEAKKL